GGEFWSILGHNVQHSWHCLAPLRCAAQHGGFSRVNRRAGCLLARPDSSCLRERAGREVSAMIRSPCNTMATAWALSVAAFAIGGCQSGPVLPTAPTEEDDGSAGLEPGPVLPSETSAAVTPAQTVASIPPSSTEPPRKEANPTPVLSTPP